MKLVVHRGSWRPRRCASHLCRPAPDPPATYGCSARIYGYKTFAGRGVRDLPDWLSDQAKEARSNEDLAQRLVARCRETLTILPAVSTIRAALCGRVVAAERRIETRIAEKLDNNVSERLDGLLTELLDAYNVVMAVTASAHQMNQIAVLEERGPVMLVNCDP